MKVRTKNSRALAFTLVEIMIVVLIIAILLAIAVPQWVNARTRSQMNACIDNLRHIDAAKEQWAMATSAPDGSVVLMNNIYPAYLLNQPVCPSGGTYNVTTVGQPPTCDIATHVIP